MNKTEKIAAKVYNFIQPFWDEIEKDYHKRAKELDDLLSKKHDLIGLVLKIHLVVEHYIILNLERNLPTVDLTAARLTFNQKMHLLPKNDAGAQWLLSGIIELNKVRNKFAHNLTSELKFDDLPEIQKIVQVSRDISHQSTDRLLNDFAIVAGAFLGASAPEIVKIFDEAFKKAFNEIEE